jgi:hypothetical protein
MRPTSLMFATLATAIVPAPRLVSQAQISTDHVSVAATNDEWTPTTIQVTIGDIVLVIPRGRIRIGQYAGEVGPTGNSAGEGALYIKIGVGAGQRVGEKGFFIADQAGPVKFRVYDSRYSDNAGSFDVGLILVPLEAIAQATGSDETTPAGGADARYLAAARSDLRNLVTAEEGFFADSVRYSASLKLIGYSPTPGITIKVELTPDGWRATATIAQAPGWTCGMFVGATGPFVAGQKEGEPKCWQP